MTADDLEARILAHQPSAIFARLEAAFGPVTLMPRFADGSPDLSLAAIDILRREIERATGNPELPAGPKRGTWADTDALGFAAFVAHGLVYRGHDPKPAIEAVARRLVKVAMLWAEGHEPAEVADVIEKLAFGDARA